MDTRWSVLLLVLGLATAAYPTLGAPFGPPATRAIELTVTALRCDDGDADPVADDVCLAYNGQIPGPLLDVNAGDRLVVTLRNEIASTIAAATSDTALIARLSTVDVSWHVHGTALSASEDGVASHAGTQLVASVAPPGGSFTYHTRLAFNGSWHYHDHVLGADGAEGIHRGLYGGLIVRSGAEPRADAVLDVHLLDDTDADTRNVSMRVARNTSFEVLIVGLEDLIWSNVQLRHNATGSTPLDTVTVGPGMSDRMRIENALPGVYTVRGFGQVVGRIEVT